MNKLRKIQFVMLQFDYNAKCTKIKSGKSDVQCLEKIIFNKELSNI